MAELVPGPDPTQRLLWPGTAVMPTMRRAARPTGLSA